ncbi:MAG: hypothetical protein Q7R39_10990, partial [Dehalococcoidia bacterium]|nr:hypothetical protein [Dehalococcoidia bacterium]
WRHHRQGRGSAIAPTTSGWTDDTSGGITGKGEAVPSPLPRQAGQMTPVAASPARARQCHRPYHVRLDR